MSPSPYFWSVLGYLVVLSVIAIRKSRAVRTEADFVLAGRGLTAPVLVATMLASWIGSGTLIAGSEYANRHGFAAIWSPAGAWLGIAVVAVLAPRVRRLEQFTLPDILELRYNRWAKLLGSITIIIAFTAIVAYQLRGMGIVLKLVAGIDETLAHYRDSVRHRLHRAGGSDVGRVHGSAQRCRYPSGGHCRSACFVLRRLQPPCFS